MAMITWMTRPLRTLDESEMLRKLSCALIVPCGGGKTVGCAAGALATIASRGGGFGIVVVPTSVLISWEEQMSEYYPHLAFVVTRSEGKRGKKALVSEVRSLIASKITFLIGMTYNQVSNGYLDGLMGWARPMVAILDEFKLRYPDTEKWEALNEFIGQDCRVIIPSATPQQNKETDLPVTAFALGMPKVFNCRPGTKLSTLINVMTDEDTLGREAYVRQLYDYLCGRCFIATDRPRDYHRYEYVLSTHGHDGQDMGSLIAEAGEISRLAPVLKTKLATLTKALQGVNHAGLVSVMEAYGIRTIEEAREQILSLTRRVEDMDARKHFLDTLEKQPRSLTDPIKELLLYYLENENPEGEPFLLFAHSLALRWAIAEFLSEHCGKRVVVLSGSTKSEDRARMFREFQEGMWDVLLMGNCGNEGITLFRARDVVMIHEQQNPSIGDQFEGRIDRMGQTAKAIRRYNLVVREGYSGKMFTLSLLIRKAARRIIAALEARDPGEFYRAYCGMVNKIMADLRKFKFSTLVSMSTTSEILNMFNSALLDDLQPDVVGIRKTLIEHNPPYVAG